MPSHSTRIESIETNRKSEQLTKKNSSWGYCKANALYSAISPVQLQSRPDTFFFLPLVRPAKNQFPASSFLRYCNYRPTYRRLCCDNQNESRHLSLPSSSSSFLLSIFPFPLCLSSLPLSISLSFSPVAPGCLDWKSFWLFFLFPSSGCRFFFFLTKTHLIKKSFLKVPVVAFLLLSFSSFSFFPFLLSSNRWDF